MKPMSCALAAALAAGAIAAHAQAPADPVQTLVDRLALERYKATVKGLTQFGDRRQGTERNARAIDWIEAQLRSYGCTNVERMKYTYSPDTARISVGGIPRPGTREGSGGSTIFGNRTRPTVNVNINAQPDPALRELNAEQGVPGPREQVYCTKIGKTRPDEMYIVSGHMDGIGFGEAANDNASGTALVMEVARVLSAPEVETERSVRFVLWNNEETGLNGARAYVEQRKDLQGKEDPPGSGRYPEPRWLGVVQHDMVMFDHGMPGPDGKVSPEQRLEADVNIEFQSLAKKADEAQKLAWFFKAANAKYATDYPAAVGPHMTNTDSVPFMDLAPAISVRENERGAQIGAGWNPHWHQPTDLFSTYSDKDFRLGLNAAQTTLAAIAQLAGATVKR